MRISSVFRRFLSLLLIVVLASASLALIVPRHSVNAQNLRDCNANAVINCGALSVNELKLKFAQNTGNIQGVYKFFGISSINDFNGLVMGSVTKSGQVFVGSKMVATNALTAGRQNMPGSTPILNGQFFERPPNVSFASNTLTAFIKMSGQKFMFAVLTSCGNPVVATPVVITPPPPPKPKPVPKPVPKPTPKTPNFIINKTVKIHGVAGQFTKSVSAKRNDMVDFKIAIKNNGQVPLTNMVVNDDLPTGLTSVDGSFSGNMTNTTMQTLPSDLSGIINSALNIGNLAVGQTVTIIFSATVDNNANACTTPLVNTVMAQPNETGSMSSQASVQVCVATPSVTPTPIPPTKIVVQQTQTQTQTQTAAPAPQAAPTTLSNTGTGLSSLLGVFGLIGAGGAMWHQMFMRLMRRFSLR